MRKIERRLIVLTVYLMAFIGAQAQSERTKAIIWSLSHGLEYEIRAGLNIGGTMPMPFPSEIRSIDSYTPTLAVALEGNVTKWFGKQQKWGVITGIRLENKGMRTKATVKDYGMEIIGDKGEKVAGHWTGGVRTKVKNSYLTIPILAAYKLTTRWNVKLGTYLSYLMDNDFSGYVYEGYLREGDPTGAKVEFKGDKIATYDFSHDLRRFQWGLQMGADWKAFKHLKVYADLNWGMNDIFKKDFKTITFDLYTIYLNFGFGYAF